MIKAVEQLKNYEITRRARARYLSSTARHVGETTLVARHGAFSKTPTPHTCARNPGPGQGDGGKSRGGGSVVDVRSKCAFGAEGA